MAVNHITHGVSFNTGISMAEYNEMPAGQTAGKTQTAVLPGSTTVSEALDSVFPKDATANSQIMMMLAAAGDSTLLRTGSGFHAAARKAIRSLKARKGASRSAGAAAHELEELLADTELLDQYRASLLES